MYVIYVNSDDPDEGLIVPVRNEIPKHFRGPKWKIRKITYELSEYFVKQVEEQGGHRFKLRPQDMSNNAKSL